MARVLIVEDDPAQREIYSSLLYYNGFDVLTAEDGTVGVRLAVDEQPDAILMDIMLPGINGLMASTLIHGNPVTAGIPIICMSAHNVAQKSVQEAGAREFLAKPVRGDTLVRAIRRHIGWDDARPKLQ